MLVWYIQVYSKFLYLCILNIPETARLGNSSRLSIIKTNDFGYFIRRNPRISLPILDSK